MTEMEPRVPMEALDPERGEPGYWDRFQARVMEAVRPALAERRRASETVGAVMLSWSRLVLPLAAAAAVVAVLAVPGEPASESPLPVAGIEELIRTPVDGEDPLPSFLHSEEVVDRDLVLLAVEGL